jgi:hypothetical protein
MITQIVTIVGQMRRIITVAEQTLSGDEDVVRIASALDTIERDLHREIDVWSELLLPSARTR